MSGTVCAKHPEGGSGKRFLTPFPPSWRTAAGWIAALFFLCIGFLFANGLSLMDHVARWPELWLTHSESGAALGTALNVGDATLWPRWLLMFGLALGTTAVWARVDAEWLAHKTADEALPALGMGIGAEAVHYRHGLGRGGRGVVRVRHLADGVAGGDVLPDRSGWLTLVTAAATGLPWLVLMGLGPGGLLRKSQLPNVGVPPPAGGPAAGPVSIRRARRKCGQPPGRANLDLKPTWTYWPSRPSRAMGAPGHVPGRLRDRAGCRGLDGGAGRKCGPTEGPQEGLA